MRSDPLQQYSSLRRQLLAERASLLQRLNTLNRVLGLESSTTTQPAAAKTAAPRDSTKAADPEYFLTQREAITQALKEKGPMTRQELAKAIQDLGYVSKAKDPLNSMGIVLYAKNSPVRQKDGKFYLPGRVKA
jgi:hypothetical protein